jgi:hypothetical protein
LIGTFSIHSAGVNLSKKLTIRTVKPHMTQVPKSLSLIGSVSNNQLRLNVTSVHACLWMITMMTDTNRKTQLLKKDANTLKSFGPTTLQLIWLKKARKMKVLKMIV